MLFVYNTAIIKVECRLDFEIVKDNPDSKVHGAHMGPNWDLLAPGGLHVGPMNFAIRECIWWTQVGCRVCIVPILERHLLCNKETLL